MLYGEALVQAGIGVMGAAGGAAVLCIIIFFLSGRSLRKKLDAEYGPKRHS